MTRPTASSSAAPPAVPSAAPGAPDLPAVVLDLQQHEDPQQHEPPGDPVCSARRCREHAVWALRWNNPRLHTPERRKTWLACDEHRDHLTEFLQLRGFLRDTLPLEDLVQGRTSAVV